MKKYQKLFIGVILLFFVFGFVNIKIAKAITIEEIKSQITTILAKIAEIQKQIDELKKEEESTTKSITLISPNGGEKWEVGKTYNIKWNASGFSSDSEVQIKLQDAKYAPDSYASELLIIKTANTGTYSWKIPDLLNNYEIYGSLYKIGVNIGQGSDKKSDSSDNYFIISKSMSAYLNVISPNGGEKWETGKTYTIKWDSLGLENYKADITLKRGYTVQLNIAQGVPNNSYYNWQIPQNLYPTIDYRIFISVYDNQGNLMEQDSSNSNFSIIKVTALEKIKAQLASISGAITLLFLKIKELFK